MTEAEWMNCTALLDLWEYLKDNVSARKLRLFGCACVRRIWELLSEKNARWAVECAERYADNPSAKQALHHVAGKVNIAREYAAGDARFALAAVFHVADNSFTPSLHRVRAAILEATKAVLAIKGNSERIIQTSLLREVVGNPFRVVSFDSAWMSPLVTDLARAAYDERSLPEGFLDSSRLSILADALEDAGCDNAEILSHCRSLGPHVRGCWVVDLILGKK